MAKIMLYGNVVEVNKADAMAEIWARGLDDTHIVEGITVDEMEEMRARWDLLMLVSSEVTSEAVEHEHNALCGYFDCAQVEADPEGCYAALVGATEDGSFVCESLSAMPSQSWMVF